MMQSTNILSDMSGALVVRGDRYPARGHQGIGGLHTVQIVSNRLVGRVSIQATLKTDPGDDDWFAVLLDGQPYAEFQGELGSRGFSFTGNFVWVRAVLDRSYLLPGLPETTVVGSAGLLDRVLLST